MNEEDRNRMADEECVLRYFAIKNDLSNYDNSDFHGFLDSYLEKVTRDTEGNIFNYGEEREQFIKLFDILKAILGNEIFKNIGINRFSRYQFEAFTLGIVDFIDQISISNEVLITNLRTNILALKNESVFKDLVSGSFLFKQDKLTERINLVKNLVQNNLTAE